MLAENDLAALTLRAPYIHEHGDRPYFMHELNTVAQQLSEPPFLNFFIRYRSKRADASKHRWSRVKRVVFLEDCVKPSAAAAKPAEHGADIMPLDRESQLTDGNASARAATGGRPALTIQTNVNVDGTGIRNGIPGEGSAPKKSSSSGSHSAAGSTVVWRNKLFWIALLVEGEEHPVHLPNISHKLPSEEEVRQFCAYQSLSNPDQTFSVAEASTTTTTATPAAEAEGENDVTDAEDGQEGGDAEARETTASARVDPHAVARTFLPTSAQIEKLRAFREERLTRHAWTVAETEEAAALHAKYADRAAGAAAAPMAATITKVRNLQLETRLLSQQGGASATGQAAALAPTPASQSLSQSQQPLNPSGPSFLSSPPQSPASPSQQAQTQSAKRNLRGQSVYTGRSPFLPKRHRQRGGADGHAPSPSPSQELMMHDSQASLSSVAGVHASVFDEATPSSQLMPPATQLAASQPAAMIDPHMVREWEQEYEQQVGFYRYVANGQRSGYLNKIADITRRNAMHNRASRLAGMEFEKKMERHANFVESAGLWITDDKLRAEKAAQYKAAQESETGGKKDEKEKPASATAAATAAALASGEAGGVDGASGEVSLDPKEAKARAEKRARERALLEAFKQKHASQDLRFDGFPDDWLNDDALFSASPAPEGVSEVASVSPSPYRLIIPTVAANAAAGEAVAGKRPRTPQPTSPSAAAVQVITSQLLHRSASSMALGGMAQPPREAVTKVPRKE